MRALLSIGILAGMCSGAMGCIDVREYRGQWLGAVASDPAVRQGFSEGVRVEPLVLDNIDLEGLSATLTTTDGKFSRAPLTRVIKFSNDPLASLTFDGDPLRSYLLFAPLDNQVGGAPAMMFISLFTDDRVELRILRGNDLFGVFYLERRAE